MKYSAADLTKRHSELVRKRSENDGLWQELKELIRPDTSDFFGGGYNRASFANRRIYDGTAPWALEQLAAGLHSYNTSPTDRWFTLGVAGVPTTDLSFQAKAYLDSVSDRIYAHYGDPFSNFNSSVHENYLDIATFGTSCLYQWYDVATGKLMFRAFPLADIWIEEDANGRVVTVHRRLRLSMKQVRGEWSELPEYLSKKKDDEDVIIIHAVHSNDEYNPRSRRSEYRAWKSCYFCPDTKEIISESGYDVMPYHTPRWTKVAGETYGRSPALTVLPDIRMVNAMSKTMIVAAQKMVDPALQVPDDGFLLPLRTNPGGLNYRRPGQEAIIPMPTAQRIDIGIEMIEQRRDTIRRGFYVDWLVRPTKKERQTASEIMDDRNQMLSMMGPITGRIQSEFAGVILRASFSLLDKHGELPAPPPELDGAEMEVAYISPAAKAQATTRGQGMAGFVQQMVQLQPIFPEVMDSINVPAWVSEMADITDVPLRVLNSPEQQQEKQAARQQQEQAAQAATMAPQVASAAKDFSVARQNGGIPGLF